VASLPLLLLRPRRILPALSPVDRRAALLGGLVALLLLSRPLAHGVPLGGVLAFWGFVAFLVVLPGVVLYRIAVPGARDAVLTLGQGAVLGLAVHGLASFGALAMGRPRLGDVAPLGLAGLAMAAAARRGPSQGEHTAAGGPAWPWLALVVLVLLIQPLASVDALGDPVGVDLLFHVGNAAEVRHRWPLQDPRAAGLPLNYHVLSYALPAAVSRWTGLPAADTLLALAPMLWIALFVLQVHNTGAVLFGDRRVGLLAAAVTALHADPGRLLGLPGGAFNSYLATGLYGSPTTVMGLIFLTGIAITLDGVLAGAPKGQRGSWMVLGLLALAAAATKASVVPAALGGLVLLAAWTWVRSPHGVRRVLLACLVLAAAAVPPTLALSTGDQSYRDMFRWAPGTVIWQSAFAVYAERLLAEAPLPLWGAGRAVVATLWSIGYFALVGVGALLYLRFGRTLPTPTQLWALGVLVAGAALAFTLHARDLSQLFFLYNGQVLLALFGAAGILAVLRQRPVPRLPAIVLGVASLPPLVLAVQGVAAGVRSDLRALRHEPPPVTQEYAAGLAWLRGRAAEGVVLADNPSFLLSALGECRTFYESGFFTPRGRRERWDGNTEPYPDRVALQERLLRRPDPAAAADVRAQLPPGAAVRVVADAVQSRVTSGYVEVEIQAIPARRLLPEGLFDLEFANQAMHVYRLKPPPGGDPAAAGGS
jgi:hypothetical protein